VLADFDTDLSSREIFKRNREHQGTSNDHDENDDKDHVEDEP